jgi:excinuclease ABC subunit B
MFELSAPYQPAGDQPEAIAKLTEGVLAGARHQTLVGVTGSGKTFTIANVIQAAQKPALVISHNKTLAAQLYAEFKSFFPKNAVEYFVSYFDYYQPEAYIPRTDTFIEKDSSINEEIERLRLSTMSSVLTRRDVIVVASVSCIYGISSKEDYESLLVQIRTGMDLSRELFLLRLVDLQYSRNDIAFERGQFRVRGDVVELRPAGTEDGLRVEFFGETIERISRFEPLTGETSETPAAVIIFPAKQFVTPNDKIKRALLAIREEMGDRIAWFEARGKLIEAQRIKMRTEYDLEMMEEMGFCSGIENYSRHLGGRLSPGPGRIARHRPPNWRHVRRGSLAQNRPGRTRLPPPQRPRQSPAELPRVPSPPGPDHLPQRHPCRGGNPMVPRPRRRTNRPPHRPD